MIHPTPKVEIVYFRLKSCADMTQFQEVLAGMISEDGWIIMSEHVIHLGEGDIDIVVRLHKEIR